ncbi:Aft1 HRA domain-containing protein [Kockiozyma suomiensis]|uniref:Aft1 HRA domain-containing protein n=1 Tax=Kockiozyma suomiensis TaxID=1337062 RepID=UPI00334358C2
MDLEPNPFEQSFASKEGTPTSAQKQLLPPVASLASPSSLLGTPASQAAANYWSLNSLRSGPLSPAMLQGPQAAAFVDSHLRSGLTPNESGIRSGLTPGGSGSIFPAPSPTTAAIFGLTTPAGISATSFPQTPLPVEAQTTESQLKPPKLEAAPQKSESTAVDSASVAANGLFLLSQGQADANKASSSSTSANSKSDKQEKKRASTRKSGRKTDEQSSNKRLRNMDGSASPIKHNNSNEDDDDEDNNGNNADTRKMTEEEKRKNFLERNRVAALKCRQRKKQWLQSLQAKCDYYGNENDNLNKQISLLREQVVSLKTLLIAHKDCSASRALPPGQDPITLALGQDFVSGLQGIPSQPQGMQSHQMANRRFV